MTQQQLSKIWTVVGLFLLYYALNTWIVVQGGQEMFGAKLIVGNRVPAAMWGIPVTCLVLFVNSLVGLRYAQRTPPGNWHDRIPIVGFESIVTNSPEGKVYQGVMLFLLSLLPATVLIHFWRIFNSAMVVTTDDPPKPVSSIWDWSALTKLDDPARICTDLIHMGGNNDLREKRDPFAGTGTNTVRCADSGGGARLGDTLACCVQANLGSR
ncbi:hypothetical protein AB7M71_006708 [Bradyrhizobium japonicum]